MASGALAGDDTPEPSGCPRRPRRRAGGGQYALGDRIATSFGVASVGGVVRRHRAARPRWA